MSQRIGFLYRHNKMIWLKIICYAVSNKCKTHERQAAECNTKIPLLLQCVLMERCLQVDPMDKLFGDVLCWKEHQDHQSRTFHVDREIPNHIYGKRETSICSGQLLKLGNEEIKALQKDPIEWPWHEKTHFRLNIMNTKRQIKGKLCHVVPIGVYKGSRWSFVSRLSFRYWSQRFDRIMLVFIRR